MILDAAVVLINRRGIKGMTFLELAQMVDLTTTSVTYYFRLKEQLAAAVFERTLDRLEALVADAAKARDPQARVARFYELHFDWLTRVLLGDARPLAYLSEIRALEEPVRAPLEAHYRRISGMVRDFFPPPADDRQAALLAARAHILLEIAFWLPAWIGTYAIGDFGRVRQRLLELLDHGMAQPNAVWAPQELSGMDAPDPDDDMVRADYLSAATRLINQLGYRGASVDRIAAELNVTKGSFYHHLDAKDDLVMACFRCSYRRIARAKQFADQAGGTQWQRLTSAVAMLLDAQFAGDWPLLRTTALQALPAELRQTVLERSNRTALRFAGMLVDGIIEGSIARIDPMIASQVLMAAMNAAYDVRGWAQPHGRDVAVRLYASALAYGFYDVSCC